MKSIIKEMLAPILVPILKELVPHPLVEDKLNFKFSKEADETLGAELKEKVSWEIPSVCEEPKGDLFKIWSKIPGAHKWHHYFIIYEKLLGGLRNKPIKILEIGVYKGASINMWKNYFHENTLLVGIDIDENCSQYAQPENNLHVRIGSQENHTFLKSVIEEFGTFDLIIDDGSHVVSHMIESFNYLYINGLNHGGIYFVEDTHSNYWRNYRDKPVSFVDFSKHLIDLMHYHYTLNVGEIQFRLDSELRINSFDVPRITRLIDEIRFFDSIIVFYKSQNLQVPVSEHL